jgi:hypothetical protein
MLLSKLTLNVAKPLTALPQPGFVPRARYMLSIGVH